MHITLWYFDLEWLHTLNAVYYVKGMQFTFEELQSATLYPADTNKIGCGGYGSVYAGIMQQVKVAVKFLSQVCTGSFSHSKMLYYLHYRYTFFI